MIFFFLSGGFLRQHKQFSRSCASAFTIAILLTSSYTVGSTHGARNVGCPTFTLFGGRVTIGARNVCTVPTVSAYPLQNFCGNINKVRMHYTQIT